MEANCTIDPHGAGKARRRSTAGARSQRAARNHLRAEDRDPVGGSSAGDGVRFGHDLLAPLARMPCSWSLGEAAPGSSRRAWQPWPHRLVASEHRRLVRSRKKGGEETGPNPTDRGRPGSKHHLIVDRQGVPLAVALTWANVHDSKMFTSMIDAVPAIRSWRGAPRKRPAKLHGDKAYDMERCRRACRVRRIIDRIARKGIESKERLGRYRWVVERDFAWLHRYRRLAVRYERRADIHKAFLTLGVGLICGVDPVSRTPNGATMLPESEPWENNGRNIRSTSNVMQ